MSRGRGRNLWSRRRVLSVAAAAGGMPVLGSPISAFAARRGEAISWSGIALGAPAKITLFHPELALARRVLSICLDEISRLESIFSLYRDGSELVLLNRDGLVRNPSLDLRVLLEESQSLGRLTDGAFDVTVQPLWEVYADHFRTSGYSENGPAGQIVEKARRRVDYRRVDVGRKTVGFLRPGMGVTLNGIAQGVITDRVADILRSEGFDRTLVDIGEIAALAPPPNRSGWRVGVGDPAKPDLILADLKLANSAVATSSGWSTRFDSAGRHHHLFDPATGRSASRHRSVSVISASAMLSDALSTALAILPFEAAPRILRESGAERALFVSADGSTRWVRGI